MRPPATASIGTGIRSRGAGMGRLALHAVPAQGQPGPGPGLVPGHGSGLRGTGHPFRPYLVPGGKAPVAFPARVRRLPEGRGDTAWPRARACCCTWPCAISWGPPCAWACWDPCRPRSCTASSSGWARPIAPQRADWDYSMAVRTAPMIDLAQASHPHLYSKLFQS